MPVTLYAISFKDTGGVVAFCSLEKKDLSDKAVRDQLLDALVGTTLPIGLVPAIEIPVGSLAIDEIATPPADLQTVSYALRVSALPSGVATPGDGTPKRLVVAADNTIASLTANAATNLFTLTLGVPIATTAPIWMFFEGVDPKVGVITPGTVAANKEVTFQFPQTPPLPSPVEILLFMEGVAVTHRSITP